MKLRSQTRSSKPQLNIAPLIDVIFLLIIFFMMVSQFSQASVTPMELPRADQGQTAASTPPQRVIINITRDGEVVVGGQVLDMAGLNAHLHNQAETAANGLEILLRGDRYAPWRDINRVLNHCARIGSYQVRVAVAESDGNEGGQP